MTMTLSPEPAHADSVGSDEEAPESGVRAAPPPPPLLSRLFWKVDWVESLPLTLTQDGIELRASDIERALPFIGAHYGEIFAGDEERARFFHEPFDDAKIRYYRACDVFELTHGHRTIGIMIGAPTDWSTYYVRTMGVLAPYQGRQLPRLVLPFMFGRLAAAGVRRFEVETSAANLAVVLFLTRMRFNVTGQVLSERWGALLRMTKFLDEGAEEVFLDKFCSGIRYQRRERGDGVRD
jgi:GNAT superfamily N-acetyltransferase